MPPKLFFFISLIVALSATCFAKPKGESTVVGCLIVEVVGSYPKQPGPVFREFDVRIECQYLDDKGKSKNYGYMTKTNADGYFKLDNVPAGQYVLKAVEFTFERTGRLTLASKFGRSDVGSEARYWGMLPGMIMDNAMELQYDKIEAESREGVIDLGITYIQINANEQTTEAGLPLSSPDGKAPWQRISLRERGSVIDMYMVTSSTHAALTETPLGQERRLYTKLSPAAYFETNK